MNIHYIHCTRVHSRCLHVTKKKKKWLHIKNHREILSIVMKQENIKHIKYIHYMLKFELSLLFLFFLFFFFFPEIFIILLYFYTVY
jgi:hypothetical protein